MIEIRRNPYYGGEVAYRSESANDIKEALEEAARGRVNLSGAYLPNDVIGGADLPHLNVSGGDMYCLQLTNSIIHWGNFIHCEMGGSDLSYNDFKTVSFNRADLQWVNFTGSDLSRVDFAGANLYDVKLQWTILNWKSHDLLAEILRQAAGNDVAKLEIAGLVLIHRGWCWAHYCEMDKPKELRDWALGTLAQWAWVDDEDVPLHLRAWMNENGVERPTRPTIDAKEGSL